MANESCGERDIPRRLLKFREIMIKKRNFRRSLFNKYYYKLEPQNQPSEQTLGNLLKMRKNKSAKFTPVSKLASSFGNKDMRTESAKIIIGTPLTLGPNAMQYKQKVIFNLSPEIFARAARVLMTGYVLVSSNDTPGHDRRTLEASMAHINTAGHHSRLDSLQNHQLHHKIMAIEMPTMTEWSRVCQFRSQFSLSGDIAFLDNRNMRHYLSEFKTPTKEARKENPTPSSPDDNWSIKNATAPNVN